MLKRNTSRITDDTPDRPVPKRRRLAVDQALSRGSNYSDFSASGNARVHAGNVYNFHSSSNDDANAGIDKNKILLSVLGIIDAIAKIVDLTDAFVKGSRVSQCGGADSNAPLRALSAWRKSCAARTTVLEAECEAVIQLGSRCLAAAVDLLAALPGATSSPSGSTSEGSEKTSCDVKKPSAKMMVRKIAILRSNNEELSTSLLGIFQDKEINPHPGELPEPVPTPFGAENVRRACSIWARERVKPLLAMLQFREMVQRRDDVAANFPHTFAWALNHEAAGLRDWLKSGSGIFWIAGKPGSGKSTLMKFLSTSSHVNELITLWSQDHGLCTANFFFWYAGSWLQKSIVGLLRSILYQVLKADPILADIAFRSYQRGCSQEWTKDELVSGLASIGKTESPYASSSRFFFLIDGLDEFYGDHLELVLLIQDLARNTRFKFCVSSRPWNAFRAAFEPSVPFLRLEDLTEHDTRIYVSGRIQAYHNPLDQPASLLVDEIVEKAEGVFLWVQLVMDSIVRGLTEGDPISFLRHRVQQFPPDLESFFQAILDRIDGAYQEQTYQCLKLGWLCAKHADSQAKMINLTDYWLLSQSPRGLQHPSFAYHCSPQKIEGHQLQEMAKETRRFLNAVTRDLLTVSRNNVRVSLLHRTAFDFLDSTAIQARLDSMVPEHFRSTRILHLLHLTRMKLWLPYTANQTMEMLEEIAKTSILEKHADTCKRYAAEYEICVQHIRTVHNQAPLEIRSLPRSKGLAESILGWIKQFYTLQYESSDLPNVPWAGMPTAQEDKLHVPLVSADDDRYR